MLCNGQSPMCSFSNFVSALNAFALSFVTGKLRISSVMRLGRFLNAALGISLNLLSPERKNGFYENLKLNAVIGSLVGVVVEDIAVSARSLGFDFRTCQIGRVATAALFLQSCVAQTLSCGNGFFHSLHASP